MVWDKTCSQPVTRPLELLLLVGNWPALLAPANQSPQPRLAAIRFASLALLPYSIPLPPQSIWSSTGYLAASHPITVR